LCGSREDLEWLIEEEEEEEEEGEEAAPRTRRQA